jgi:hypothetical protein
LWATLSARASTSPPRSPTPTILCAPARGANSTPARPTSQRTPSRRSHHVAFCRVGAGHCRAPAKGARGLHPPAGRH